MKRLPEGGEKRVRKNSDKDTTKDGEQPTEEMVERMEERLEAAQADQKNLFLIIFQVRKVIYYLQSKRIGCYFFIANSIIV